MEINIKAFIKGERPNRSVLVERTNTALRLYYGREQLEELIPKYSQDEDDEKYKWRKRATIRNFRNFSKEITRKYMSSITRAGKIVRTSVPLIDNDENDQYPLQFWKDIAPYILLLDEFYVGVYFPEAKGEIFTEKDQQELQGNPRVRPIFPQYIRNVLLDEEGCIQAVAIERMENGKLVIDYYDETNFATFSKNGEQKTDWVEHGFPRCPILRFAYAENDSVGGGVPIGNSLMADVTTCELGLLDCVGMLFEAAYLTLHVKLVVNQKTFEKLQELGFGNATPLVEQPETKVDGGLGQTRYLQMPSTEIDILKDLVYVQKKDELYEIAQLRNPANVNVQSGVAKMIDMVPEDELKAEISRHLAACDKRILDLRASAVQGYDPTLIEVKYPTVIDGKTIADTTSETEAVSGAIKTGGLPRSMTGDKMLSKRLYHKSLPDADEPTLKIIDDEIDNAQAPAPIDPVNDLKSVDNKQKTLDAIPAA